MWVLGISGLLIAIVIFAILFIKPVARPSFEQKCRDIYVRVCNDLNYEPTEYEPEIHFQALYDMWLKETTKQNQDIPFADFVKECIEAERFVKQAEEDWINGHEEMDVKEFFTLRQERRGELNFVGVYILHNVSDDMYYVGQAVKIGDRVNQHFTGKGNGNVYADWKYGSEFTIRLLPLNGSEYNSLDRFERDMIAKYHANEMGYNKTAGNSK